MKRKLILISIFFFIFSCLAESQEKTEDLQFKSQEEYEVWNEGINYFLRYLKELENKQEQENKSEVRLELSGIYEETINKDLIQGFFGIAFEPYSLKSYIFSKVSPEIEENTIVDFINKNQISYKLDGNLNYKLISTGELENIYKETEKILKAMESKQIDNFYPHLLLQFSRVGFNQNRMQALVCIEWYPVPPLSAEAIILLLKKDKGKWSVAATYSENKT